MILKNFTIPSTMSPLGLDYLGTLAKSVPENGVIVEIGPLFGSSTWVLAKNSHPSVRVFSIDTWEPAPWITKVESKYRNVKSFSLEAFKYYTRDCENVFPIQGWSPAVVSDWSLPIDMFFDDATHGDPGFSENLNFFSPFVKPGAILCGDDYSHGWPDIVSVVDRQAQKWGRNPEVAGRVWAIRAPDKTSETSLPVNLAPKYGDVPEVKFNIRSNSGRLFNETAGVWAGAVHQRDLITSISAEYVHKNLDIELTLKLETSNGRLLHLPTNGQTVELEPNEHICGFCSQISGSDRKRFSVISEASFTWFTGTGAVFPIVGQTKPGWLRCKNEHYALTAVRLQFKNRKIEFVERLKRTIAAIRSNSGKELLAKLKRGLSG